MVALQERNFSPSSDLYKGHKVVAMPATGGDEPLSVRDMVITRTVFDPNRPRSKSAGRASTRSRDIVQEVYDRMGVNRGAEAAFDDDPFKCNEHQDQRTATPGRERGGERSAESADKFSQRYRAAAALSSPRGSNDRGRDEEQDGGSARRCRSLSRGRAVAGRWPPAQNKSEQPTSPQPVASFMPRKVEESKASAPAPHSPNPSRKHTYSRSDSQEDIHSESDASIAKEENPTAPSVPSIKDRINVYAGRNSSRNFPQKKPFNYQTYASQKRPAPIDIYQDARKQDIPPKAEESTSDEGAAAPPTEPNPVPPSPAAAAAADAAFAYVRGGNSSRSVKSAGPLRTTPRASNTNGIAGTYLGAIKSPNSSTNKPSQQQTTSAPLTEISAADPNGDGHSVAASSVSADEFNFSSPVMSRSVGGASTKKPSWAERNKPQVSPTARNTNGGTQYNNNSNNSASRQQPSTPSAAEIEKMVEQRVKARVSVVEMRMEEQMLRLERRVEEKLNARIGMLDEKIDKMNSMLAMLLSRELSASENERRDNEI